MVDKKGCSALHLAVRDGNEKLVALLLEKGNKDMLDKDDATAYDYVDTYKKIAELFNR